MRSLLILLIPFFTTKVSAQFLMEGNDLRSSSSILKEYADSKTLLDERRMGLGLMAAGPMGLFGVQWQLNFASDAGFSLGYGASRGFRSFNLDYKQYLGQGSFVPFVGGGYSRWTGTGNSATSTSPQFVADRFLSKRERETGEFAENILYPSFGIQYFQLTGEWSGLSFIAELLYAIDSEDFVAKPYAGIGSIFYF